MNANYLDRVDRVRAHSVPEVNCGIDWAAEARLRRYARGPGRLDARLRALEAVGRRLIMAQRSITAQGRDFSEQKRFIWGGILLGLGLGGFFDGIVLHQILQWHHMLSNVYAPTTIDNIQLNVLADGLFHAFTYVATVAGLIMVWTAARRPGAVWSGKTLLGTLLFGWGIFNLVEGIINHHILQVHHVRPGPDRPWWDLGFLAWGAVMVGVGWWLMQVGQRELGASEQNP